MPTLIREHKVFIAESPLYEITSAKKIYFAYNDAERDKITAKLSGKYTIQRSKGLGENEPDMMWETTMNPETRKLVSVQPADVDKTLSMFDMLLGDNIKARKDFIEEFGYKYIDTAEAQ
jgi:DNA gyrase subunit B